ncbi:MAG: DinB family protein [Bacteroidetes bacterium]|nr:MAG: DinB family protein [Bacteroidota bacterium]
MQVDFFLMYFYFLSKSITMNQEKLEFLRRTFVNQLKALSPDTPPAFGKMNVQQMIEHMSDSIRYANGKDPQPIITPDERLGPMKAFILSEKDFRPNTPNSLMSDTPPPCRNASKDEAIAELEKEIQDFVEYFESRPGITANNPFFGALNYAEWVQGLHKHALHHLRQFSVAV